MKKVYLNVFATLLMFCFSVYAENNAVNLSSEGSCLRTSTGYFTGNATFTLELWFKVTGTGLGTYPRLLSFTGYTPEISITDNGNLHYYDGNWNNTGITGIGNNTGWHHLAFVKRADSCIIYINGAKRYAKVAANMNFTDAKYLYIGLEYGITGDEELPVIVDEIRIWNTQRTKSQIANNYRRQLDGYDNPGLVGYYPFTYAGLGDFSPSKKDLLVTGNISYENTRFGTYLDDFALNFDGKDDAASCSTFVTNNDEFTFEAKFRTVADGAGNFRRIFGHTAASTELAVVNGELKVYYNTNWRAMNVASPIPALNTGEWHHVALAKSASSLKIYLDGALVGTFTGVTLNPVGIFYLGGTAEPLAGDLFLGDIDEVRVWSVFRTQQEIVDAMNIELKSNETNLLSYFDMNTPTLTADVNNLDKSYDLVRAGLEGTNKLPQYVPVSKSLIVGIFDVEMAQLEMSMYPNPTKDQLNIVAEERIESVQVLNASGLVIEEFSVNAKEFSMSVNHLKTGLYVLKAISDSKTTKAKFVKE